MSEFLQQLLNGLSLGAIYALIALGYTMVYGVLRFINFAHSDVFMVGAFIGYYVGQHVPENTVWGGLVVLVAAMAGWKKAKPNSARKTTVSAKASVTKRKCQR